MSHDNAKALGVTMPTKKEFKLFRCDFKEKVGNKTVKAHRYVIAPDEISAGLGLLVVGRVKLAHTRVETKEIKMNKRMVLE